MNQRIVWCGCLCAFLAGAVPVFAASNAGSTLIRPRTPEAAQAISRLEQARNIDRMNAQSYTGGADSEAGISYYRKGREVDALLSRLREGHAVSVEDVQRALDNSDAARFIGNSR